MVCSGRIQNKFEGEDGRKIIFFSFFFSKDAYETGKQPKNIKVLH